MVKYRKVLWDLVFGILIGLPNFFFAKLLLIALKQLPGVVVYPTYCVSTLLVVSLAGVLFFREKLRKLQWLAVSGIAVALVLLNI